MPTFLIELQSHEGLSLLSARIQNYVAEATDIQRDPEVVPEAMEWRALDERQRIDLAED